MIHSKIPETRLAKQANSPVRAYKLILVWPRCGLEAVTKSNSVGTKEAVEFLGSEFDAHVARESLLNSATMPIRRLDEENVIPRLVERVGGVETGPPPAPAITPSLSV